MNPSRTSANWLLSRWRLISPWLLLALGLPLSAHAGLFGISPIRVDLDRENRTGSIAVSNDDPDKSMQMQAKLMEWSQDAEGKDIYVPSNDLVYFPQIFTVAKLEQQVVRVGLKAPSGDVEKSYRLFIEELPPPREAGQAGAQIQFVLRFGIPVFVRPQQEQLAGTIERAEAGPGMVSVILRNSGNANFQIQGLTLNAADGYTKDIVGGYTLAAATKAVEFEMPLETCRKSSRLEVSMKTDRLGTIARTIDLDTSRCRAK